MSSWWPDLSDVLAPLGLSSRPIEPGGSFHEDATRLVDGRQFGPTHTVLLVDEDSLPVGLFELVRHPDTLWINRVQVLGELLDRRNQWMTFATTSDRMALPTCVGLFVFSAATGS